MKNVLVIDLSKITRLNPANREEETHSWFVVGILRSIPWKVDGSRRYVKRVAAHAFVGHEIEGGGGSPQWCSRTIQEAKTRSRPSQAKGAARKSTVLCKEVDFEEIDEFFLYQGKKPVYRRGKRAQVSSGLLICAGFILHPARGDAVFSPGPASAPRSSLYTILGSISWLEPYRHPYRPPFIPC